MSSEQLDARGEEILDRRAAKLASRQAGVTARRLDTTVALVSIAGEIVGIPVASLREIIKAPPMAALPKLPPWLPGIMQVRGEILCAVDLMRWLGRDGATAGAFLAVLEGPHGPLGLLVDTVVGFREVYADELADELDGQSGERQRAIRAVTKDLVSLLEVERLLGDERIVIDQSAEGRA